MNKVISVVAMCAGSFLLGGSLGLALSNKHCETCEQLNEMMSNAENRLEKINNTYGIKAYIRKHDDVKNEEDPQDRMRYNRETGEYEPFEADEEVISTVEDLVQSYISKDDERPELDEEDGEDTDKEERYSGQSNELSQDLTSGESEETERDGGEDNGNIFLISTDSFLNEYKEVHSKNTLTYYELDNVLVDDRDEVIREPDEYVGPDALDSFGEGSDDENIVYVRNLKKEADYEIIRDERSYQEVVLGYKDDEAYVKARKYFNLDKEESEE